MSLLKNIFYLLYKLYFMLVFVVIFVALYPFFLIGFHIIKNDKFTFLLHVIWAYTLNFFTFIFLKRINYNSHIPNEPFIIVSNHTSFLDVFLMFRLFPTHPFVFMAKSELLKIPVFGILFKYYHIPVYRNNRRKSAEAIIKGRKIIGKGMSIAIFPEGGIIDGYAPRVAPFKNGAFELAKNENIGVLPVTFTRNFKIIGDTGKLLSIARPGIAEAVIHPFITKEEIQEMSILELKRKCFETVERPLKSTYGI